MVSSESLQEPEDAAERHFWGMVLRALWTALILILVVGVLVSLTTLLGWKPYLLLCFVGLLAGVSLVVAVLASARSRELTTLILGAVTLPALAAYLGVTAAENDAAFSAYSARLAPFFAYAIGAVLGGVWISRIWAGRPARPSTGAPP
jgi:hypothetical protein